MLHPASPGSPRQKAKAKAMPVLQKPMLLMCCVLVAESERDKSGLNGQNECTKKRQSCAIRVQRVVSALGFCYADGVKEGDNEWHRAA
ncbi:MAG: hypothetical protein ACLR17_18205 [Enterobacteriaceae bacterium]